MAGIGDVLGLVDGLNPDQPPDVVLQGILEASGYLDEVRADDKAESRLANLDAVAEVVADFPDITAGTLSHAFKLKAAELGRLIERTQFAISTEETRYYLNGIYLHTIEADGDLQLRAVATDGHRLARADQRDDDIVALLAQDPGIGIVERAEDDQPGAGKVGGDADAVGGEADLEGFQRLPRHGTGHGHHQGACRDEAGQALPCKPAAAIEKGGDHRPHPISPLGMLVE